MTTDNQTRKQFRAIGHKLSPVLINAADRDEKQTILDANCTSHRAELIQLTGHIALLYRAALKQKRELSNLVRHAEVTKG